jgi:hypothetical protein
VMALRSIGSVILEPALRAFSDSSDVEFQSTIAGILADVRDNGSPISDARVFTILLDMFDKDTGTAGNLSSYGDPEAIPHLQAALDRAVVDTSGRLFVNQDLIEILAALDQFGVDLTPSQQATEKRLGRANARIRRQLEGGTESQYQQGMSLLPPVRAPIRPGRNELCWCGSTKKYKKCHLDQDAAS